MKTLKIYLFITFVFFSIAEKMQADERITLKNLRWSIEADIGYNKFTDELASNSFADGTIVELKLENRILKNLSGFGIFQLGFYPTHSKNFGPEVRGEHSLSSVGIFSGGSFYFLGNNLSEGIKPFLGIELGYIYFMQKIKEYNGSELVSSDIGTNTGIEFNPNIGVTFPISNSFVVTTKLKYSLVINEYENDLNSISFNIGIAALFN